MVRKKDLTGKIFGRLTVVRENPERSVGGRINWDCLCECGNEVIRQGKSLLRSKTIGATASCGCYKNETARQRTFIDIQGQRFGRLLVKRPAGSTEKTKTALWECLCDCGQTAVVRGSFLRRGHTTSCGCRQQEVRETAGNRTRTHGMSDSREYHSYRAMLARCHDPKYPERETYGGRGISVCKRWREGGFSAFFTDMGACPPGMSIDRIDNNKGYSPENCRWADALTQGRNRRCVRWLTHDGKTLTIEQWSKITGIKACTIRYRLKKGWGTADALSTPVGLFSGRGRPCR